MLDVEHIVKNEINQLWSKYSKEAYCEVPPLSIGKINNSSLIFIGINPSLSKESRKELLKRENKNCDFYTLKYDINDSHKYFKKFYDISNKTNLSWSHLDLLFIRETQQNKVKDLLKNRKGIDFIYQQCMISKSIIDEIINQKSTKIFVVNNSLARDLLGTYTAKQYEENPNHWIGYNFTWDKALGTFTYKGNPFFFTSMLTGQRALDNGSYQRLIWHINFVKEKMKLL